MAYLLLERASIPASVCLRQRCSLVAVESVQMNNNYSNHPSPNTRGVIARTEYAQGADWHNLKSNRWQVVSSPDEYMVGRWLSEDAAIKAMQNGLYADGTVIHNPKKNQTFTIVGNRQVFDGNNC